MRHEASNLVPVTIDPGPAGTITSFIEVADVPGVIRDVDVMVDINHTWTQDLRLHLIAPDGVEVLLVSGEGGSGDDFRRTTFDDAALTPVSGSTAPFRGTFRPEESLSAFHGITPNGVWALRIEDRAFQDGGALNRWALSFETCSHTFSNDTPVAIDSGPANTVTSSITTENLGGLVVDEVTVLVDIDHTWDGDLRITLTAPDGTAVDLVDRKGGSGDGFDHTTFDDDGASPVEAGSAPFRGTFRPEQPLSAFRGALVTGTWTLRVEDQEARDGGWLNRWELRIESCSATPQVETDFSIEVEFVGGLTANQRSAFEFAAARWAEVIVGDLPAGTVDGREIDDVLIRAEGARIDGRFGILGQAGPTWIRGGSSLPLAGEMTFDTADLADMEQDGTLVDVIIHEMGHVLGIGTLWSRRGLIADSGTGDAKFTGPNAMREYAALRGESQPRSVPLANTGGPGTEEGHWREVTFDTELMTGFVSLGANPLSRMTIASLEDLGYEVNLAAADLYRLPGAVALATAASRRSCRMSCPEIRVVPPSGTTREAEM